MKKCKFKFYVIVKDKEFWGICSDLYTANILIEKQKLLNCENKKYNWWIKVVK